MNWLLVSSLCIGFGFRILEFRFFSLSLAEGIGHLRGDPPRKLKNIFLTYVVGIQQDTLETRGEGDDSGTGAEDQDQGQEQKGGALFWKK